MRKSIVYLGLFIWFLLPVASAVPSQDLDEVQQFGYLIPERQWLSDDVMVPSDISIPVEINDANRIIQYQATSNIRPRYFETSEYMIGSVAVGIILPESNGSIDPSTENWTDQEITEVLERIQTALAWWSSQNPNAQVSFETETNLRIPTGYEPISRPSTDDRLWIGDVMKRIGYGNTSIVCPEETPAARFCTSGYFRQIRDYVNSLRTKFRTDWAFVIFVADSSADSDGLFSDNKVAYAVLGGPFLVESYKNDGWGISRMNVVTAHEIGHIFYATDEYDGKTDYSGYLNAPDCEDSGKLMASTNNLALSDCTKLQIGWRNSDGDAILDILDTSPTISLAAKPPALTDVPSLSFKGSIYETPYPNQNARGTRQSITINRITGAWFRVDDRAPTNLGVTTGSLDDAQEEFSQSVSVSGIGIHRIEISAQNSVGNFATPLPTSSILTKIIVDRSDVTGTRVNIGSSQTVTFHAIWAHDGSPVSSGTLTAGVATSLFSGQFTPRGSASITITSSQVGSQPIRVAGVNVQGITTYNQTAASPSIIWDRIRVDEIVIDRERVDVGTAQDIIVRLSLEYDRTPLGQGDVVQVNAGNVNYNATIRGFRFGSKLDSVGALRFTVTGAKQSSYGIDVLLNPIGEKSMIWDRVKLTLDAAQPRVSIGSEAVIRVSGIHEYDNGVWSGSAKLNNTTSKDKVGKVGYTVASITDTRYGLAAFISNVVLVIFDRVAVTLSADKDRINVGDSARISVTGKYESDSRPWTGTASLNDTLSHDRVGRFNYGIRDMADPEFGITAFRYNSVPIIFDRVAIELSTDDDRINVGDSAKIVVMGKHEYDSRQWSGTAVLNDTTTKNSVGRSTFTVMSITDPNFGIMVFTTKPISIIFDKVNLNLTTRLQRVQVGSKAPLEWSGHYEFDRSKFTGDVIYSDELSRFSVGKVSYTTAKIVDKQHDLSSFASNSIDVIFDKIERRMDVDTLTPGSVKYAVALTFASDSSPVQKAEVRLDGMETAHKGAGRYEATLSQFLPYFQTEMQVVVDGFEKIVDKQSTIGMGNSIVVVGVAVIVVTLTGFMRMKRKTKPISALRQPNSHVQS